MLDIFGEDIALEELEALDLRQEVEPNLFEFVISYYTYQPVIDMYMPHLEVVSNYGDRQVVPFFGEVLMQLSAKRYCTHCYHQIEAEDNFCMPCLKELGLEFLNCVKIGPGFGKGECDLENPACGSEFSQKYCKRDHVLYVAVFEDRKLKVGMTRKDRVFNRLIEQGASYAMVFQREEGERNFVKTHQLEQTIGTEFGIPDLVVFEEKLEIFKAKAKDLRESIWKLEAYQAIFEKYYRLQPLGMIDLRPYFFPLPDAQKSEKDKLKLNGRIIGFRGSVGYIQEKGEIIAFDLNKLKGRKIENVSG